MAVDGPQDAGWRGWRWLFSFFSAAPPHKPPLQTARTATAAAAAVSPPPLPDVRPALEALLAARLQGAAAEEAPLLSQIQESVQARELSLPMLSDLAQRLLALDLDGPEDGKQLANLIRKDQDIAARLIQLGSAARFGSRPARSLEEAVVRLGHSTVQKIAIGLSTRARLYQVARFSSEVEALSLRAVQCAGACHALASRHRVDPGLAYLGGLFHDVGQILLLRQIAEATAGTRRPVLLRTTLSGILEGELHCLMGAWFAQERSLPPEVCRVIAHHHQPSDALSALVWAVQHLQQPSPAPDAAAWSPLAPPREQVEATLQEVQAAVAA